MDQKQLGILNSLVTYAAEQMAGGVGMTDDEREVVRIVGGWVLGTEKTHNVKVINASSYGRNIEDAANFWVRMGWRVVGVVSDTRPGYSHALVLERPVWMHHPDD